MIECTNSDKKGVKHQFKVTDWKEVEDIAKTLSRRDERIRKAGDSTDVVDVTEEQEEEVLVMPEVDVVEPEPISEPIQHTMTDSQINCYCTITGMEIERDYEVLSSEPNSECIGSCRCYALLPCLQRNAQHSTTNLLTPHPAILLRPLQIGA